MRGGCAAVLLALGLTACASPSARGASAEKEVETANGLFGAQQYSEALEAYTRAAAEVPQSLEVVYDQGCCQCQLGNYEDAAKLFRKVDQDTRDLKLAAAARYDLGHCLFRQGMKQADSDLQQALNLLQAAAASYQRALELAPDDQDAARNIEVVRLVIKDLMDRLKKQQEEQKKQQQQQEDLAKKLQELAQRQEAAAKKSGQTAQKSPADPQRAQETAGLKGEQEKITTETKEALDKLAAQNTPPPSGAPPQDQQQRQEAVEKLNEAQVAQQLAQRKLEEQAPGKAEPPQHEAAKDIEEALKKLSPPKPPQGAGQEQQESDKQPRDNQPNEKQADAKQQEQQKQDATAAEILDKERQDREEREKAHQKMAGHQPVDKDW